MSNYYVDFLKRRAKAFLESAQADFDRGGYDLVLFHVEQFLQLYLKHLLYRKIGDFPKTYSVVRLVKDVIKVYNDDRLKEFYKKNLETLYLLEEAYISSRYLPREYDEDIAERILKFAEKVLEVLEWLEKHS
ncbi:MAG: HEPN domain-containing protein [Candidatus Odinarchaeota archaeon]|nr:HEPN domain-containing protein [Candidatus Odinarchaeota archaeon]